MSERGRHYDWPAIKAAYVEGTERDGKLQWLSLDACAELHDAIPSKVRERAAKEGWVDERAAFRRRIEEMRQEERGAEIARLGTDLDVAALRIARSGLSIVGARLLELTARSEARRKALEDHNGDDTGALDVPPAPSSSEVERLSRSAHVWYRIGRDAMGDTPSSAILVGGPGGGPIEVEVTGEERRGRAAAIVAVLADADVQAAIAASGVNTPDDDTLDTNGRVVDLDPAAIEAGPGSNGDDPAAD